MLHPGSFGPWRLEIPWWSRSPAIFSSGGGNHWEILEGMPGALQQKKSAVGCFTVGIRYTVGVLLFSAVFENSRSASSCVLNRF